MPPDELEKWHRNQIRTAYKSEPIKNEQLAKNGMKALVEEPNLKADSFHNNVVQSVEGFFLLL